MTTDMRINAALLVALVLAALGTVMSARLLRAVIGLAVTSAILTVLMFRLDSPIAAVFELSVCAGLIPAILISAISLTQRLTPEALTDRKREKLKRYWPLPVIVVLAAVALLQVHLPLGFALPPASQDQVRNVLWNQRHEDLLGQVVVLLGGAFAVVVLLKGSRHER